MNASPIRSVVESRNAPKTVAFAAARQRPVEDVEGSEPIANTIDRQKKNHSFRYSK
jgi:hypothetical protein